MQSCCLSLEFVVLMKHLQKVRNYFSSYAVLGFVLYFRCLNEFYYLFVKVQLLWLLHSIGPLPYYYIDLSLDLYNIKLSGC